MLYINIMISVDLSSRGCGYVENHCNPLKNQRKSMLINLMKTKL